MDKTVPSELLERRKLVRVRLRDDLNIAPHRYEGRIYYVVKDPVSLRYYRFKEQEHFLLKYMDGQRTLDEAQKEFEKRFRPERLTLEDLEAFAQQLLTAGLAQNEAPQAGKQLYDRRRKRVRMEWMRVLTNILYIKIPLFDPDRLLTRMLRYLWPIFTMTFLVVSVGVMLAAVLLVATHFDVFRERLPSYHEFFSFKTVAYLWLSLSVVKVIHEFGHGLSCKAFGGEVHEMGALFMVFSPCLYCNVSDAWSLPDKWKRIIISGAGIYVELIIAALATFIWWNTPAHPFINNLSLSLMIVCSVSTFVFNANPLMRFDGYYVLADWLEIPNLRERCNRYIRTLALEYCLGVEVPPEPYMALRRKILFLTYAVVSYFYLWFITFSILWFMSNWLPDQLKIFTKMLMVASLASMFVWPAYRIIKNVHKRGRLPDMKTLNVSITLGILAVILLFIFLVKLPVGRVREPALIDYQPDYVVEVPVPAWESLDKPPILERLYVRDGQPVEEGEDLAEFSHLDVANKLSEARAEFEIREEKLKRLDFDLNHQTDGKLRDETEREKARVFGEKYTFEGKIKSYEDMQTKLKIKAPRAGIVVNPPHPEEVGKQWERNQLSFCKIGDPTHLRAIMPISPGDRKLLHDDWSSAPGEDTNAEESTSPSDLSVTMRVRGRGAHTWKGCLVRLQKSSGNDKVPIQLTTRGGGPIPVKPGTKTDTYVPQSQQFFAYVDFIDPDNAICPGTMGQVKVHCRWHSIAWWAWRTIANAFDVGLL